MSVAAPSPHENQGQPEPRIDARLKVTGAARYAADIPLNDVAHGVLVTSDIARGRVRSLALDAARATPGVLDIVSYGDLDGVKPPRFGNSSYTSLAPLHDRAVRHDGQIMALVVAETLEAAQEAADKAEASRHAPGEQAPTPRDRDERGQGRSTGSPPAVVEDQTLGTGVSIVHAACLVGRRPALEMGALPRSVPDRCGEPDE